MSNRNSTAVGGSQWVSNQSAPTDANNLAVYVNQINQISTDINRDSVQRRTVLLPLSRGYFALVDDGDFPALSGYKWSVHDNGCGNLYAARMAAGKRIFLHRFIVNAATGIQVDHENGNGLDCRRFNLRVATASQNGANRGCRRGSQVGFRGVSLSSSGKKWRVRLKKDGKDVYLGQFPSPEAAAKAYDDAALAVHREFARPNFIPPVTSHPGVKGARPGGTK